MVRGGWGLPHISSSPGHGRICAKHPHMQSLQHNHLVRGLSQPFVGDLPTSPGMEGETQVPCCLLHSSALSSFTIGKALGIHFTLLPQVCVAGLLNTLYSPLLLFIPLLSIGCVVQQARSCPSLSPYSFFFSPMLLATAGTALHPPPFL